MLKPQEHKRGMSLVTMVESLKNSMGVVGSRASELAHPPSSRAGPEHISIAIKKSYSWYLFFPLCHYVTDFQVSLEFSENCVLDGGVLSCFAEKLPLSRLKPLAIDGILKLQKDYKHTCDFRFSCLKAFDFEASSLLILYGSVSDTVTHVGTFYYASKGTENNEQLQFTCERFFFKNVPE